MLYRYVDDILKATPKSIDQVTIEPNGTWLQTVGNVPSPPGTSNGHASTDGEEELVEIKDVSRLASVKSEVTREPGLMRTPPVSSREQSTSSAVPPPVSTSSNKRPASQVVDLTFSSDEDDDPPRAAKIPKPSSHLPKLPLDNVPLRPNGVSRQHSSNTFNTPSQTRKDYGQPYRI